MENYTCELCAGDVCLNKLNTSAFSALSFEEKIKIVVKGRCVPRLDLTQKKGNTTRSFNKKYYDSYNWLAGCLHTNKLFCFPCLLFSNKDNKNVWISNGYSDLNNFHKAAAKHDLSEKHLDSCLKFQTFGKGRIESSFNKQFKLDIERHNAKVDRNRNIFKRLIDVVCFLGKQELAFRGHAETTSSLNKGNFLELVDLLAKYDGNLATHLQSTSSGSFTGLSNRTQNDLISSVGSVMYGEIKKEISETDFLAIMVDETPDVGGREQLVLVLRYFRGSEVIDRFIKYIDVSSDRTAVTLCAHIINVLEEFHCLNKLVAQTYDGAPVLSSEINGVQSLLRQKCPLASYVWCSAHVLNLILSKAFERVSETKRFFSIVRALANFFHGSTKRTAQYNEYAQMRKLPRVSETRWTYHSRTVNVIATQVNNLVGMFEHIQENDDKWDGETLIQVSGFLNNLKEFEFNFLLHTFSEIFSETDILYEILQKKTSDIVYCAQKITEFEIFMEQYRNKFDIKYNFILASNCDRPKRKRGVDDVKLYYKRVFYEIIDNVLNECRSRYKNLKDLNFFKLLAKENYTSYCTNFPDESVVDLLNTHEHSFNADRLRNELRCVYKSDELKTLAVFDLIQNLHANNLTTIFPEVYKLAKLIVTIPVSTASAERSFSCLKRIHTYLRNTQGQSRLTDLSMIAIEKELLTVLKRSCHFYDDVLQNYLKKDRRVDLIYKH